MQTLLYKGKEVPVGSGKEIFEAMQLLASDLGAAVSSIGSLANDVRATIQRDNNRDSWLKRFFDWSVPIIQRSSQGAAPIGLLGLFNPTQAPAPTAPAPTPTEPTTPTKSAHRLPPPPTIDAIHPDTAALIRGFDRAHLVTLQLTTDYLGSTALAEVTFGTEYGEQPIVIAVQVGPDPAVNPRVSSQTNGSYRIYSDPITIDQNVLINVIVVPTTELENFD